MCETPCTCGCPACAERIPADFGAKVAKNALLFAKTPEEGRALVEFFAGAEGVCTGGLWAQTCRLHVNLRLPAGVVVLVCMRAAGKLHPAAVTWRSRQIQSKLKNCHDFIL
jgi:hypothetical protein